MDIFNIASTAAHTIITRDDKLKLFIKSLHHYAEDFLHEGCMVTEGDDAYLIYLDKTQVQLVVDYANLATERTENLIRRPAYLSPNVLIEWVTFSISTHLKELKKGA